MISVNNVTVDFGTRLLFDNVSFVISNKDKIALVGRNGAGKSTLLKLIAKLAEPTSGHIARAKELRTGYLPQHMQLVDEHTVYAECETAFSHIRNMQADLDNMSCELSERTDYDSESYLELIERFTALNERMNVLNTGSYHAEIERTLIGWDSNAATSNGRQPNSAVAGVCVSNWPNYCCDSRISCFWTNQRTTSTSNPFNGWKASLPAAGVQCYWYPTIKLLSTTPRTEP